MAFIRRQLRRQMPFLRHDAAFDAAMTPDYFA
jgi:hypothetical protein